ncbi:MAG TPA: 6-phosphogluconolactonase, partial [Verrucomicrobiae bacterium]|nr:6-phosphogluconolactonase [Verrucomicrobiae bacterium]
MNIQVFVDSQSACQAAAETIALEARTAAAARKRFVVAFSGGHSPAPMLQALAREDVPWQAVHVLQVDERVAPPGNPDRNFVLLHECLLAHVPLRPEQIHPMPVENPDLALAAHQYGLALQQLAGNPPVLDLLHLGLGPDGHTASLVPGDPDNEVTDTDVAVSGFYQGRRRLTLTFPAINRARRILWLVTGGDKAPMLPKLRDGDTSIPAGRVRQEN